MRKTSYFTVSDHFCGCGGNSEGIFQAGAEVREAVNHDERACLTYAANHRTVDVVQTDLLNADPRRHPRTDMLVASPECRKHTSARGKKRQSKQWRLWDEEPEDPAEQRSRMTMRDVVKFSDVHRYEIVVVENVVDVKEWPFYDRWLSEMRALGYEYRELFLNAMFFHPTPQSRDRIYIVFWKRGNRKPNLDFHPRAYCARCERDVDAVQSWKNPNRPFGKYGKRNQYVYRCPVCTLEITPYYYCAWNVIDWSLPCPKVGERTPPLAEPTRARIEAGLRKYAGDRAFLFPVTHGKGDVRFRPLEDAFPTQTARQTEALAVPPPFIVNRNGGPDPWRSRPLEAPVSTVVAEGSARQQLVIPEPFMVEVAGRPKDHGPRPLDEAMSTVVATGNHHFLAVPPPFIVENHGNSTASPITEALATVCAGATHAHLAVPPPFMVAHFGERPGQEPRTHAMEGPTPTVTSRGAAELVVPSPFIVANYGGVDGNDVTDALRTVTTRDHNALAVPHAFLASYYRTLNVHGLGEAVPTIPSVERHALVELGAKLEVDDCGYRMLEPHELKRAQGFPEDYQILGSSKRDKTWLIGNANPPKTMRWIIGRCIDSLR